MRRNLNRRTILALPCCAALLLGPAAPPARAQAPPGGNADYNMPEAAPAEDNSGDPLYGYVATAFLAAGAVFALCKSARR